MIRPVDEIGSGSLAAAARFAAMVLDQQVLSMGKDWDPKLAYTAAKYLRQNLPETGNEPDGGTVAA